MTTSLRTLVPALVLVCFQAASATTALGQSVFNAAGLGVPTEALDGRSRAMGSMGIGLPGGAFMPTDPGALGRLRAATGVVATQPSWMEYSVDAGESGSFQSNRFPLLGVGYPLLGGMMSVQIGSFLDQNYRDSRTGSVTLSSGTVTTSDEFVQDGSVSKLNLGYSRMFGDDLSVGLVVGRYAGSVVRTLTRTYGDVSAAGIDSYVEEGRWSYDGFHVTSGVSADLNERVHVAASIQLPTDLDANASEATEGSDRSFDLPIQYRAGASAAVGGGLLVAASVSLADWSVTENDLVGGSRAGDSNGFGVGVELTRARLWGKDAPLRFGFRQGNLPFSFVEGDVEERIFSGGLGLALNRTNDVVLASMDVALERGQRTGLGIDEDFWRMTLSFQASGF